MHRADQNGKLAVDRRRPDENLRRSQGARRALVPGCRRRALRDRWPRRLRQDDHASHSRRRSATHGRRRDGAGHQRGAGPRGREAPHRVHVAALRTVRRSLGRREHRVLRRPLRRPARRTSHSTRAPLRFLEARAIQGPARGQPVRGNEAEAVALLRSHSRAGGNVARRADLRRRPDLPAGALDHHPRDGGERDDRHCLDGVPRRSGALRSRRDDAPGPNHRPRRSRGSPGPASRAGRSRSTATRRRAPLM